MTLRAIALSVVSVVLSAFFYQEGALVYAFNNGKVHFKSEAPLELIQAESDQLKGLIDFDQQTFAFTIAINSFRGFNSALQREHFNENYMESERFPKAAFSGKLIEKIDPSRDGEYRIRAKGKLSVHGVERERIIPATVIVKNQKMYINSGFVVMLEDHNIAIPKVVQHKIAESIFVDIQAIGEKK
jgi:polyisoprenoid-binding protein YceI